MGSLPEGPGKALKREGGQGSEPDRCPRQSLERQPRNLGLSLGCGLVLISRASKQRKANNGRFPRQERGLGGAFSPTRPPLPWRGGPGQTPSINSALLQKEAGVSSPGGWLSLGTHCWTSARPTLAPKDIYGATKAGGWWKLIILGGKGETPPASLEQLPTWKRPRLHFPGPTTRPCLGQEWAKLPRDRQGEPIFQKGQNSQGSPPHHSISAAGAPAAAASRITGRAPCPAAQRPAENSGDVE